MVCNTSPLFFNQLPKKITCYSLSQLFIYFIIKTIRVKVKVKVKVILRTYLLNLTLIITDELANLSLVHWVLVSRSVSSKIFSKTMILTKMDSFHGTNSRVRKVIVPVCKETIIAVHLQGSHEHSNKIATAAMGYHPTPESGIFERS